MLQFFPRGRAWNSQFFKLFCTLNFFLTPLIAHSHTPFLVLKPLNAGFFAEFGLVLGALEYYEKNPCSGVRFDFEKAGLYYDPAMGDNFLEYYFERIHLGQPTPQHLWVLPLIDRITLSVHSRYRMSTSRAAELIAKYIRIKPAILNKVDQFLRDKFTQKTVIGIHYRGTDKALEAPRMPYEDVYKAILDTIFIFNDPGFLIFVATDEQAFIDYMESKFPGKIIKTCANRSTTGEAVHFNKKINPYELGEQALIDCLLLSRCNFLIRTTSNLSYASSQFNPYLPCRDLNITYWEGAQTR